MDNITRDEMNLTQGVIESMITKAAKVYQCDEREIMIAFHVQEKFILMVRHQIRATFSKEDFDAAMNSASNTAIYAGPTIKK